MKKSLLNQKQLVNLKLVLHSKTKKINDLTKPLNTIQLPFVSHEQLNKKNEPHPQIK